MSLKTTVGILTICLTINACSLIPSPNKTISTSSKYIEKTYAQFASMNKFPYVIDKYKEKQILKNYDKIKLGMTKMEVFGLIGDPDFSEEMIGRDSRKCQGSFWTYYFKKQKPDLEDENSDMLIEAYYNSNKMLVWIIPSNIPELKVKGSN